MRYTKHPNAYLFYKSPITQDNRDRYRDSMESRKKSGNKEICRDTINIMATSQYDLSMLPPMPHVESRKQLNIEQTQQQQQQQRRVNNNVNANSPNSVIATYSNKALQISLLHELQQQNSNNDVDTIFNQRGRLHNKLLRNAIENHTFVCSSMTENVTDKPLKRKNSIHYFINTEQIKLL